jgi:pimeloyl-ACP methyl ester carboxylesterase
MRAYVVLSGFGLLACVACGDADIGTSSSEALTVGNASLTLCSPSVTYYCGTLTRALDPAGEVKGTIDIHYEWYPHTASGPSKGTIVAIEGGPGYGSTESRDYYVGAFDLTHRDMLLVDARGTGLSQAINCKDAQTDNNLTQADITACGVQLGNKSDLYGSDMAADDMVAIMDLLGVKKIDLYGDSYGTYSSQIFAGRHGDRIRTLVLDAAYPVLNADPFFAPEGAAITTAFNNVCKRSPDCSGTSTDYIEQLLAQLRAHPNQAPNVNRNGDIGPLSAADMALMMNVAAEQYNLYSELDPAVRAYLAGDTVPLVRLVNETYPIESGGAGSKPKDYSIGMFLATTCQDGPTAYDMTLPPGPKRNATYQTALTAQKNKDPNIYYPFTIDEFLSEPLDWSITPTCLNWPVSSSAHPEGNPVPSGKMPDVPTMVLTGDLDTVTPMGEGDEVAAEFKHVTRVIVPNGVHVTAIGDTTGCLSNMVNTFVATGGTTDTSCAATASPAWRLVPNYALTVADVSTHGVSGASGKTLRQTARAAVLTAGDAFSRYWNVGLTSAPGLRGGTMKVNNAETKITLTNDELTSDLAVSGTITMDPDTLVNTATLTLSGVATGTITFSWTTYNFVNPQVVTSVTGTINGTSVNISVPEP